MCISSRYSCRQPSYLDFRNQAAEVTASFSARLSVNTIDAAIDAGLAGTYGPILRCVSCQVYDFIARPSPCDHCSKPSSRHRGQCI